MTPADVAEWWLLVTPPLQYAILAGNMTFSDLYPVSALNRFLEGIMKSTPFLYGQACFRAGAREEIEFPSRLGYQGWSTYIDMLLKSVTKLSLMVVRSSCRAAICDARFTQTTFKALVFPPP